MNAKKIKVFIIHTSFVSVEDLTKLFKEYAPEAEVRHIVDDSLLAEVLANGGVTEAVGSRMVEYYKAAEDAGASLIFNQCSSVGEVADLSKQIVKVPVIKVDEEMARAACVTGRKIGVVATLKTTLGPTCRLVESTARQMSREVEITRVLVEGAFEALISGDRGKHNEMVLDAIRKLTESVDVVVCAQGSMKAIVPDLGETRVPVLTSPDMGVRYAAEFIKKNLAA
jgi:aspartate/glutamate racemase